MYKGKFASELSMNDVKEYYDELRERRSLTKEQWADFNILQERLIVFACKILDGKTNGGMIMAMFPNASVYEHGSTYSINNEYNFNSTWWNAKYKSNKEV